MTAYRADIEGLRALAVILVILYHFQVPWVSGGFIGVDVFFVISGFVITQLLMRSFSSGKFRFADFYARRIRRLVPVFLLVSSVTFLMISPFYMDEDYYVFAKSWLAALGGISNFYFSSELSQYFAPSAQAMPLLHTWSLGVEEQYYLLWPAVLLWLWSRYDNRISLRAFSAVWILMLLLSIWMAHAHTVAAYYLLPARIFELMLGAGVALFAHRLPVLTRNWAQALTLIGVALIVSTALIITSRDPFPGLNALWPTWGTALILYAGLHERETVVARLLSTRVMVFLGGISYSLYLWHWPPIALLNYQLIEVTWPIRGGLFALVLLLSWLSYRFVENRFRYRLWSFRKSFLVFILIPLLPIWAIQATIRIADDLSFRIPPENRDLYRIIAQIENTRPKGCFSSGEVEFSLTEACWYGAEEAGAPAERHPDVMLIGDSHAQALLGFVETLMNESPAGQSESLLMATYASTPFILPEDAAGVMDADDQDKVERTRAVQTYLQRPPMTIVSSAWWNAYLQEPEYADYFLRAIEYALAQGHRLVLLEDVPELPSQGHAFCLLKNLSDCSIDQRQVEEQLDGFRAFQQQVRARFPDVEWINPRTVICNGERCETVLNGIPLYRDESHLNYRGAQEMGREFLRRFGNPLYD